MKDLSSIRGFITQASLPDSLVKWCAGALALALEYVFPDVALRGAAATALALVVIDTVTGVLAATQTGVAVSSARMGRVLVKILGYSCVVLAVALATRAFPGGVAALPFTSSLPIAFVVVTELVSILENAHRMGLPIPHRWIKALKGVQKSIEEGGEAK